MATITTLKKKSKHHMPKLNEELQENHEQSMNIMGGLMKMEKKLMGKINPKFSFLLTFI